MQDAWNVEQYERFKKERAQPFHDLVALCSPLQGGRAVDLGCGTGELTLELHRALGAGTTIGVDRSEAMLAKSAGFSGESVSFLQEDIGTYRDEAEFDLVFSNAALQWLPDHPQLFEHLAALVRPGGQIAIQVPRNTDHPAQIAARELASKSPYVEQLNKADPLTVLEPEAYALLLNGLGFEQIHVRLQVYLHRLGSRADVVEWSRGTLLTDYQRALPRDVFDRFLGDYRALIDERLEDLRPYPYTFKRILLHARKPQ